VLKPCEGTAVVGFDRLQSRDWRDGCGHNNTLGGTCISLDTAIKSLQRESDEVADWPRRQWCSWRCHRGNMGHQLQELGWEMDVRGKGREIERSTKTALTQHINQTSHAMGVVRRHVFAGLASPVGFAMSDLCGRGHWDGKGALGAHLVAVVDWLVVRGCGCGWLGSNVCWRGETNRQKETGIVTSTKKRDSSFRHDTGLVCCVGFVSTLQVDSS
jgi:hypothetical protein